MVLAKIKFFMYNIKHKYSIQKLEARVSISNKLLSVNEYINIVKKSKSLLIQYEKDKNIIEIGNEVMKNVENIESLILVCVSKANPNWIAWDRVVHFKHQLIQFYFFARQAEEEHIRFLKTAFQLEYLGLCGVNDLTFIKTLTNLKSLELRRGQVRYSYFGEKFDLQHIRLEDISLDKDIHLPPLPKLGFAELHYVKEKE